MVYYALLFNVQDSHPHKNMGST